MVVDRPVLAFLGPLLAWFDHFTCLHLSLSCRLCHPKGFLDPQQWKRKADPRPAPGPDASYSSHLSTAYLPFPAPVVDPSRPVISKSRLPLLSTVPLTLGVEWDNFRSFTSSLTLRTTCWPGVRPHGYRRPCPRDRCSGQPTTGKKWAFFVFFLICKTSDLFVDIFHSGSIVEEYLWPSLILYQHWKYLLDRSIPERKCDPILWLQTGN